MPDSSNSTHGSGSHRLIAEEVMLLLLDDEEGTEGFWVQSYASYALAGAVLAELSIGEIIELSEPSGMLRSRKVKVTQTRPVSQTVLGSAVETIGEKGRSPDALVDILSRGLRERLIEGLVADGILEAKDDKFLLVFDRTRWPMSDATHERAVRDRLDAALLDGAEPDRRTAVLVALLNQLGQTHKVVQREGVSSKSIKERAEEIADKGWATKASQDAIDVIMVTTTM